MKYISFVIGGMTRGGAERVISILSNYYAFEGWKVDIVMMLDNEVEYELNPNINLINMTVNKENKVKSAPKWVTLFRKYAKENKPDVIVSFVARINIVVLLATLGMKIPVIISERNDPEADGRSKIIDIITKILYLKSDAIVFQTKKVKNYFGKAIQKKGVIISNPITVSCQRKREIKHKIVTAGRLAPQKNHDLLLDAFFEVSKKYPEYELWIYGEGTLRNHLEERIKKKELENRVYLPGNVPNIHECIADAEMFVLSSDYEGLSNALLEAMMMGIPCISTTCAGSDEIIKDGENGLLVPIGNSQCMVKAIEKLIEDKELRNTISQNSISSVEKCKTDNVIKSWKKVISGEI